jgi:hypothetical protein
MENLPLRLKKHRDMKAYAEVEINSTQSFFFNGSSSPFRAEASYSVP